MTSSAGKHGCPAANLKTPSTIASLGSAGVENTFKILILPPSKTTQSVNVPPVSTPMRKTFRDAGDLRAEALLCGGIEGIVAGAQILAVNQRHADAQNLKLRLQARVP